MIYMPMRRVRAGPLVCVSEVLSERLQLPVANATSILHNPVELDAVAPRLC